MHLMQFSVLHMAIELLVLPISDHEWTIYIPGNWQLFFLWHGGIVITNFLFQQVLIYLKGPAQYFNKGAAQPIGDQKCSYKLESRIALCLEDGLINVHPTFGTLRTMYMLL